MLRQLSPLVRCLTAPNGNRMTGPGTNSYLLGREQLALIDPGPVIDSHIDTLLDVCGEQLRWILVTHTHPDHSPAARVIAERSGAELIGCVMDDDGHQDRSFRVAENLRHGQLLETPEFTLQAIHTPGHVANQFCYLLQEEGLLFSGDHIMEGSSVVIIPPQRRYGGLYPLYKILGKISPPGDSAGAWQPIAQSPRGSQENRRAPFGSRAESCSGTRVAWRIGH